MTVYKEFPDKKYNVIYADPAWEYNDKCASGKRGASFHYKVNNIVTIQNLPVADIADKDCALFMWVPMPMLPVCWGVLDAWGFTYKTNAFTWVKRNRIKPTWFWGMGNWTRANAELCLLATRGKPKRVSAAVHSVVEEPIGRHSEKPDEVRQRIVKLMGDVPRIELFARQHKDGWDAWGDEL